MFYVYLLKSLSAPDERYVGSTDDLKERLKQHNNGESSHTRKFTPWALVTYTAFTTRKKAEDFERYLKHGSGHAFAKRHFW
ncbi:MAG: GIY-YIG nuclease family protein [Alphaproteobacteria bacterium]|nr:MAG: GIY-YIG nuclease family protein [Alphaproteobacteria bacterium]